MLGASTSAAGVWLWISALWMPAVQKCRSVLWMRVEAPFFIRIIYPIPTSTSPRGDGANFRQIFPLSKLLAMGNILTLPPEASNSNQRTLTSRFSPYLARTSQPQLTSTDN